MKKENDDLYILPDNSTPEKNHKQFQAYLKANLKQREIARRMATGEPYKKALQDFEKENPPD